MPHLVKVATCALAQWAMDFDGNLARTLRSIEEAKAAGCVYRLGPELELSGYGCEDHFLEQDTFAHCWDSLAAVLRSGATAGILCDIGMPVMHRNVPFNCRVFVRDGRLLLIRPKLFLANDGNYRETRWFSAWQRLREVEDHVLPPELRELTGQKCVPFGVGTIETLDTVLGSETCEELFTPDSPNILMALDGTEIVGNGSGSHHQLTKLDTRMDLIRTATRKEGGVYLYANQQGCDGGRLYFDGCACIFVNGDMVAMGSQFSLREVEVVTAAVDLEAVRSYRGSVASRNVQASAAGAPLPRLSLDVTLGAPAKVGAAAGLAGGGPTPPLSREDMEARRYIVEEEIAYGPACWLWDYLRRSSLNGFFLPLSGGADSSATAAMVGIMCQLVFKGITGDATATYADAASSPAKEAPPAAAAAAAAAAAGAGADAAAASAFRGWTKRTPDDSRIAGQLSKADRDQLLKDVRNIVRDDEYMPASPEELCSRILYTCYMGSVNSSEDTRSRAEVLAGQVGSFHKEVRIDDITKAFGDTFAAQVAPGAPAPRFKVNGGTWQENIALQNIQARTRMVLSYFMAQLIVWSRAAEAKVAAEKEGAAAAEGGTAAAAAQAPKLPENGALLVLGSANTDEALRGYYTKYDCSAADLNPIGGISKTDLKRFLLWAARERGFEVLSDVVAAPPTAELEPLTTEHTQTDEEDMGMTYDELKEYGNLRKIARCGPVSMFERLCAKWAGQHTPRVVGEKVKHFFRSYAINRHKMTTLTPSYHAEDYSPDDNRFDLRQFLYPQWTTAFRRIDELVAASERDSSAAAAAAAATAAGDEDDDHACLGKDALAHVRACSSCRDAVSAASEQQ